MSDGFKIIRSSRLSTDLFGEARINFTYPQLPDNRSLKVKAVFRRPGEQAELTLNLRHEGNQLAMTAFPEGGNLIEGVPSRVVLQAADFNKLPVQAGFRLLADGKEIARFRTNEYGVGSFKLEPHQGLKYEVEADDSRSRKIPLVIHSSGISLKTTGNDTILVCVRNRGLNEKLFLVCRSQEEVLAIKELEIGPQDSLNIPVTFNNYPKTVLSMSVIDGNGRVKAERLVLHRSRHDDYMLRITPEKTVYGKRTKVNSVVTLTGNNGEPLRANLSVAVVEKSRIDSLSYKSILNYFHYRNLDGTNCNSFISKTVESSVDDLLITKQWYNNNTEEVLSYQSQGSPRLLPNTGGLNGAVISRTKKKPALSQVLLSSGEGFAASNLDSAFTFSFSPKILEGKKGTTWKIENLEKIYDSRAELLIFRYEQEYDTCFVRSKSFYVPSVFNTIQTNQPRPATSTGNGKKLREVTITARSNDIKKDPIRLREELERAMMDRYCRNGIRNCVNHPEDNFPPPDRILEQMAKLNAITAVRKVPVKRITIPELFPEIDFEKGKNTFLSFETTLHWIPNFNIAEGGKNTFSFFTNDVKGDFLIVVQGIDADSLKPVFGMTSFSVK